MIHGSLGKKMFAGLIEGIRSFIGTDTQDGVEARDKARVLCRYAVNCSAAGERTSFPALVVDISRAGMRLEGVSRVCPGDHIWVSYATPADGKAPGVAPVLVEVMWSRKRPHDGVSLAGVRYRDFASLEGSWVYAVLGAVGLTQDESHFQKRKYIRMATALRAELKDGEGERLASGLVVNLSVGGTQMQSEVAIEPGTPVVVTVAPYTNFPVFSVPGEVLTCRSDKDHYFLLSVRFIRVKAAELKTLKKFVLNLVRGRSI